MTPSHFKSVCYSGDNIIAPCFLLDCLRIHFLEQNSQIKQFPGRSLEGLLYYKDIV